MRAGSRHSLSPRASRVASAAVAAIARWESGLEIGRGDARDLFETHGVSGLVDVLRGEAERHGDATPATLVASQRATQRVSIAGIRRSTARGLRHRVRAEADIGWLRLRGWRQRRTIRRTIRSARSSATRIARRCERKLRRARSEVLAADLRAEAFAAVTEACAEAWRALEEQAEGPAAEDLRREIQEIHLRALDRVRSSTGKRSGRRRVARLAGR